MMTLATKTETVMPFGKFGFGRALAVKRRFEIRAARWTALVAWSAVLLIAVVATRAAAEDMYETDAFRPLVAAPPPPPPAPAYTPIFDAQLTAAASTGDFVGLAVAVIDDGAVVYERVFGETENGKDEPVTADTVFRLASVSKGFATSLVGQLVEDGRLAWDDPVRWHTPKLKLSSAAATKSATVENLASQALGLPSHAYDNLLESGRSRDSVLEATANLKLKCAPGRCYGYQNTTFSLLEDVVEAVEEEPFEAALKERIFKPLGMEKASVGLMALMTSDSWAKPHRRLRRASGWSAFTPNDSYYKVAAAGGLNASLADLTKWAQAQMGYAPDVLSPTLLATLHSPRVSTPVEGGAGSWTRTRLMDGDYGLGWRVYDYAGHQMIMHAGGVAGYRSLVAWMPDRKLGVVVLWNTSSTRGWRIMPTLFDLELGLEPRDWLGVDDIVSAQAAGTANAAGSPTE